MCFLFSWSVRPADVQSEVQRADRWNQVNTGWMSPTCRPLSSPRPALTQSLSPGGAPPPLQAKHQPDEASWPCCSSCCSSLWLAVPSTTPTRTWMPIKSTPLRVTWTASLSPFRVLWTTRPPTWASTAASQQRAAASKDLRLPPAIARTTSLPPATTHHNSSSKLGSCFYLHGWTKDIDLIGTISLLPFGLFRPHAGGNSSFWITLCGRQKRLILMLILICELFCVFVCI